MNISIRTLCCLTIITSSPMVNAMLTKPLLSLASALKLVEQPKCADRIRPIIKQPKVKEHLNELAWQVYRSNPQDKQMMGTSMYDAFNEGEKEALTYAFTQGLTRMLALWNMSGSADRNDFFRFYLPHTFFRNYPPFDVYFDDAKNVQVDLFLPVREMYLKRLADHFPSTSSHVLRYEDHIKERFSHTTEKQTAIDWVELFNAIEDFDSRLHRTAEGIDNPCLTRIRLTSSACSLLYNDRR